MLSFWDHYLIISDHSFKLIRWLTDIYTVDILIIKKHFMNKANQDKKTLQKVVFKFKANRSIMRGAASLTQHPTTTGSGTFPTTQSAFCRAN